MIYRNTLILSVLVLISALTCADKNRISDDSILNIAFYNLDNLFDTINNPQIADTEFTPQGRYKWNTYKYNQKLLKLAKVIATLPNDCPDILGVCELENANVLNDLAFTFGKARNYKVVHYDSEDERGIDVGLLYNTDKLKLIESKSFKVRFTKDSNDKTRDLLWVKLNVNNSTDTFQFIVCHFPSRREGKDISMQNRIDAANACKEIIKQKCNTNSQNLILLGDFNDEPFDISMSVTLQAGKLDKKSESGLFNLMYKFDTKTEGTYRYKGKWNLLDQFVISKALCDGNYPDYLSKSVGIKSDDWMFQKGKYAGYPLRTYGGINWLNGYSDHLPIYMTIALSNYGKKKTSND